MTGSENFPNFWSKEAMDPPGTYSRKMLSVFSSTAVPKYMTMSGGEVSH